MLKRMWKPVVVTALTVSLAACGTQASTDDLANGNGDQQPQNQENQTIQFNKNLSVNQNGQKLEFTLDLTNKGNKVLELPFNSGLQVDFVVYDKAGNEVYRSSEGTAAIQSLQTVKVEAGKTHQWTQEWSIPNKLESGNYSVEAIVKANTDKLPVSEEKLKASTKVEISNDAKNNAAKENSAFRNIQVTGENGTYAITGEARVFEGVFSYGVTDGHVYLKEENVNLTEGAPTWSSFSIDLNLSKDKLPENGTITLELFEHSAKDGSKTNTLIIPLESFPKK